MSLVKKAAQFAKEKHKHQKRRTGEPYFVHPRGVARIVAEWSDDQKVIAAAYLHDTIEDTGCDYEDLAERFGTKVADYVSLLSRDFRKPKEKSLKLFRRDLQTAPPEVKLICAADAEDNARSVADAGFMRLWFKKISKTLPAITHGKLGKYKTAILTLVNSVRGRSRGWI